MFQLNNEINRRNSKVSHNIQKKIIPFGPFQFIEQAFKTPFISLQSTKHTIKWIKYGKNGSVFRKQKNNLIKNCINNNYKINKSLKSSKNEN